MRLGDESTNAVVSDILIPFKEGKGHKNVLFYCEDSKKTTLRA